MPRKISPFKVEAERNRAYDERIANSTKKNYDAGSDAFLRMATCEALQDDAPVTMLLALCHFVAAK